MTGQHQHCFDIFRLPQSSHLSPGEVLLNFQSGYHDFMFHDDTIPLYYLSNYALTHTNWRSGPRTACQRSGDYCLFTIELDESSRTSVSLTLVYQIIYCAPKAADPLYNCPSCPLISPYNITVLFLGRPVNQAKVIRHQACCLREFMPEMAVDVTR